MSPRLLRGSAITVVIVGIGVAVLATFQHSLIPIPLSGLVDSVEVSSGTSGRLWVVTVDGQATTIDARVARTLRNGARVEHLPWTTSLRVDKSAVSLRPSPELFQLIIAGTLVCLCILASRRLVGGDASQPDRPVDPPSREMP